MTVSVTNWYTAGGQLKQISERCEAFQRGDQPEKIDHLTTQQIKELHATATAIVKFAVLVMSHPHPQLEFKHSEIYRYAKSYSKSLSHVLLRRCSELSAADVTSLQEWLDKEITLPTINVMYV